MFFSDSKLYQEHFDKCINEPCLKNLLDWFSIYVWESLKLSVKINPLEAKTDEREFTNVLVRQVAMLVRNRRNANSFRLFHSQNEKSNGSDLEFVFKIALNQNLLISCQAKRLYNERQRKNIDNAVYASLNHGHEKMQVDLLLDYAKKNKAIPMYFLYNYSNQVTDGIEFFGCTILKAQFIKDEFENGKDLEKLSFKDLHPPATPISIMADFSKMLTYIEDDVSYLSDKELKQNLKQWRELEPPLSITDRFVSSIKFDEILADTTNKSENFNPRFRIILNNEPIYYRRSNFVL